MPADMLNQLQESKLRALDELIAHWMPGVTRNDGDDLTAVVADVLVNEGIGLRQGLMRLWDYYWTAALSGKVADRQKEGAALRSLLDRGSALLARAAAAARKGATLSGRDVTRLAQLEEQSKAFPLWVEECMARWELLDRPRKPVDREKIARARAAFERGECEPVSDIIARLEKGGPLVQE